MISLFNQTGQFFFGQAHACGDWLRYNLIKPVFVRLVSSTLQQRRRFQFDILSHSIRSSNASSLGSRQVKMLVFDGPST